MTAETKNNANGLIVFKNILNDCFTWIKYLIIDIPYEIILITILILIILVLSIGSILLVNYEKESLDYGTYLWKTNYVDTDNPFETELPTYDTLQILEIKDGYVKYRNQRGKINSRKIKYFKYATKKLEE